MFPSVARPLALILKGSRAALPAPLTGRLLPERAIRRGHVLENEITRHRITSFRFVEHTLRMECPPANGKCGAEIRRERALHATKPLWRRAAAAIIASRQEDAGYLPGGTERMDSADRAARIIRIVVEEVKPDFAVRLWNGERIGPANGPAVAINDPRVVGRAIRSPVFNTLIELWISKAIDVENGSLFDIVERRPQGKLKAKLRQIPKLRLLRDLPALLLSSGRDAALDRLAGRNPFVSGSREKCGCNRPIRSRFASRCNPSAL